ncbi:MAG TPA: penicillin-binding transpeptidase domain-containing protein [Anaerovoracaceae bacterium]|nr:penicillin-binding transpeptidase domain-containing protein [Anaerovoracaceae bacterium]
MKLLTSRALGLLILALLLVAGMLTFTLRYAKDAPSWAQHPTNKHLYSDGKLKAAGKILGRNGEILFQAADGAQKYLEDKTARTAMMHAVGDSYGDVATSVQVVYADKLSGWDRINGAYRFHDMLSGFGSDITLNLDTELCSAAYKAMNGKKGTVGVYNYKTGEVLCMVSLPSFDPENRPDVEANPDKYEGVYINRLLSAAYTPGSIFKLVTAAAAIDRLPDIDTKIWHCEGETIIEGAKVTCPTPHGDVNFSQALAVSCNVAFAQISLELGGDTLQEYAEKAGFNTGLTVDGIKTAEGRVDISGAAGGDLAWAGIGQYSDTANPLNFMAYVGAIANDGVRVTPKLISDSGILSALFGPEIREKQVLSKETADKLGAMMRNNVKEVYGENNFKGLEFCAKSGTAEVGKDKQPHSWFTGYLEREDCPLAFVVIVENGGSGSRVAGAVAGKVLQAAVKSMTEQ